MKIDITKPKLKKLSNALYVKKVLTEYELARKNLSSDALEEYTLSKLKEADAKRNIEEKLSEEIEIIDSVVVFKKNQEERIVKKIEKKLIKKGRKASKN